MYEFNIAGFYPKFTSDNKDIMEKLAALDEEENRIDPPNKKKFRNEEDYQEAVTAFNRAATEKAKVLTKLAQEGADFDGKQFVLHGPMDISDAVPAIKKWMSKNYEQLAERSTATGRKFATATKLHRLGYRTRNGADEFFAKAAVKFYFELSLAVKVAGLRKMLLDRGFLDMDVKKGKPVYSFKEGLFPEIDPTKTVGGDPESRAVKSNLGDVESDVTNAIMSAFPMDSISKWFQTDLLEKASRSTLGKTKHLKRTLLYPLRQVSFNSSQPTSTLLTKVQETSEPLPQMR